MQQGSFLMLRHTDQAPPSRAQSSAHFLWITLCVSVGGMADVLDPKGFFHYARKSGKNEFTMKSIT